MWVTPGHLPWNSPLISTLPCQTFFWNLQKSPSVGTRVCSTPVPGTCHSTGTEWILHDHRRAGHSHTCPSDPDPQYPPRTAKPGKGRERTLSWFSGSLWSCHQAFAGSAAQSGYFQLSLSAVQGLGWFHCVSWVFFPTLQISVMIFPLC